MKNVLSIFRKKFLRHGLLAGLILAVFIISFSFSFFSWNEQFSISTLPERGSRDIATNQGQRKIATIENSGLLDDQNIFKQAQVTQTSSDKVTFTLGNIIVKDKLGNKNFVCDTYSKVSLFFEALDISSSGRRASMKLTGDCSRLEGNESIGPFTINHKKILNSPLDQVAFDEDNSHIEFSDVIIDWPKSWLLKSVVLENHSDQLAINYNFSPENIEESFEINF